jgi:hypothetical protein
MWHREGFAQEADVERADYYLKQAADKNYAPAILDLAILNFQRHQDKEGLRLLTKVVDMGFPKATQLMAMLQPKQQAIEVKQEQHASTEGNNIVQVDQDLALEGEVITIIADEQDPVEQFAEMIDMIRKMKIYNHRGTTGTRVGDRKCGQPGSGCRVEGPPLTWP